MPPSLFELCARAYVLSLAAPAPAQPPSGALLPPGLVRAVVAAFERAWGPLDTDDASRLSLVALQRLAPCWQPEALELSVGADVGAAPAAAALSRLALVGRRLRHLELSAPLLASAAGAGCLAWTAPLHSLTCLSLAGCEGLPPGALAQLRALPNLRALCLRGVQSVDDGAGPALAALTQVAALDLTATRCGDGVLECITYGHRLRGWAEAAAAAASAAETECAARRGMAPAAPMAADDLIAQQAAQHPGLEHAAR